MNIRRMSQTKYSTSNLKKDESRSTKLSFSNQTLSHKTAEQKLVESLKTTNEH